MKDAAYVTKMFEWALQKNEILSTTLAMNFINNF